MSHKLLENLLKMNKHTNFTEEFYEAPKADWLAVFFATLAVLVALLILSDFIWGAETITDALADLVIKVRNY